MNRVCTRRDFAGWTVGALGALGASRNVFAAGQCTTGPMQAMLPNRLVVNCASRQNFQLFRQYSDYLGLTGVVTMIDARGAWGTYNAGSLFLFPWLKPKGQALRNTPIRAAFPIGTSMATPVGPIPNTNLPLDEYFCRVVLEAPWQNFVGFAVDTPLVGRNTAQSPWCSNIPKLGDGQGVSIDWTSSNLNRAWFGGSNFIPNQDTCNGNAWRMLIADGVNQVSTAAC